MARGGASYLGALPSHGARIAMLRRQCEFAVVVQILKTPFFRLPPEANTRRLNAQLYVWTELGQNQYLLAENEGRARGTRDSMLLIVR